MRTTLSFGVSINRWGHEKVLRRWQFSRGKRSFHLDTRRWTISVWW